MNPSTTKWNGIVIASLAAAFACGSSWAGDSVDGPLTDELPTVPPMLDDGNTPHDADSAPARETPDTCTYAVYNWSVTERRAVNFRQVRKAYSRVSGDERDPNDARCSVCTEDQVYVGAGLVPGQPRGVQVCWAWADKVQRALEELSELPTFEFTEVTGYRPGRTRGRVENGMRMQMSNHAYGTAVDINADHNGLYRGCAVAELTAETIRRCSLSVGGAWDPESHPRTSITANGPVVDAFTRDVGWKWGGAIDGHIRDIMHFSLTGY